MYKLEPVALDSAKMPDPILESAVMYRLSPPKRTFQGPGGPTPQTLEEFESQVKNDAQSFILSSTNDVRSPSTSNDFSATSFSSNTIGVIIEKLGAISSPSLSSELLSALHHWDSLLKKIQKLEQHVSKVESITRI